MRIQIGTAQDMSIFPALEKNPDLTDLILGQIDHGEFEAYLR